MEYYMMIKKNKPLLCAPRLMTITNIMISIRSMIPFTSD